MKDFVDPFDFCAIFIELSDSQLDHLIEQRNRARETIKRLFPEKEEVINNVEVIEDNEPTPILDMLDKSIEFDEKGEERRASLFSFIKENPGVRAPVCKWQIASKFGVNQNVIQKDLKILEREGKISVNRKSRGGNLLTVV